MVERILLSGLVLLPFYELIIYILMPRGKIPQWIDFRVTKEYIAIGVALVLTVFIWKKIKKIECPNLWTLVFIVLMFFSMSKSPIVPIKSVVDLSLVGAFSAEFKVFTFFLMFCSLASYRFSKISLIKIFKTIFYVGVGMSIYMIFQALNLDQILKPKPEYFNTDVKSIGIGGFLGQPTLVVPLLAMAIPFGIYLKKWLGVLALVVGCLLTGSDFGVLAIFMLVFIYISHKKYKYLIYCPIICLFIAGFIYKPHGYFIDNARFSTWTYILADVFTGNINGVPVRIGMFGGGINNFGALFTSLHETAYVCAHNEFLQILWCCGVFGLGVFLMIHYHVLMTVFHVKHNKEAKTLGISLAVVVLCAMGTFVYQLGIYQFYIVAVAALIYQLKAQSLEIKNV